MALAASSPPAPALTEEQEARSLQLDEDIAKVRAEISTLTQRRTRLTSALLSSSQVQSRLRQQPNLSNDAELTKSLQHHAQHSQQSAYRLAFGVTAFPFIDPSPDTSDVPLIGIRFDVCKRSGQFETPHFVLCKRVSDESSEVRVHRHTIPALVPLSQYEDKYLPLPDEGYGSEDSVLDLGSGRQDLEGFANAVRSDLVAWRLRQDSIEMVREELGLSSASDKEGTKTPNDQPAPDGNYGVSSVEAIAVDAHFVRIVWADGRLGRVRIGRDGNIQQAGVVKMVGEAAQQCPNHERLLMSEGARIDSLVEKLKEIHESHIAASRTSPTT